MGDLARVWQSVRNLRATVRNQRERLNRQSDRITRQGERIARQGDRISRLERQPDPEPEPEPAGRPWAWDARSATVDPDSESYISTFLGYALRNPNLATNRWAVATAEARDGDPEYSVPVASGGTPDPLIRIPLGTRPDPAGDGHLTVSDPGRGREHDFYGAAFANGRIVGAKAIASFEAGAVNEQTDGWGGNAANTPLRRGLVTPEHVLAGYIGETLQFGCPEIGRGAPRFPALHNAPTCQSCEWHMPEGSWVRLSPSVDVGALDLLPWERTVARAMQDHGMILRDNAGALTVYGKNPINGGLSWPDAGLGSGGSERFSAAFPWDGLELLVPPSV